MSIFLSIVFIPALGQVCETTQFSTLYGFEWQGGGTCFDKIPGTDKFYFGGVKNYNMYLSNADVNGKLLWSKQYKFDQATSYFSATAVIDSNGNYFINLDANAIAMLDSEGNVITVKEMKGRYGSVYGMGMGVLPDNKKVILVNDEQAYGRGFMLVCLAPDLSSVIWTKHFSGWEMYFGRLVIDGYNIFLPGSWRNSATLLGFDGRTGDFIGNREFRVDGKSTSIDHVHAYKDGYILQGKYYGGDPNYHLYFRLNKNLDVVHVSRFLNVSNSSGFTLAVEPDGSFYGVVGGLGQNRFYINNNDSVVWNKATVAGGLVGAVKLLVTKEGLTMFGSGNWHNVGIGDYSAVGIARSDENGQFMGCPSYKTAFQKVAMSYTAALSPIQPRDTTNIDLQEGTITVTDNTTEITEYCKRTSTCNALQVAGEPPTCSSESGIFRVKRNPGCSSPMDWKIEGGPATFQKLNDSTILVTFLQGGTFRVIAALKACSEITDTLEVRVKGAGPLIQLGADTLLCPGANLTLNAKKGFVSYQWQDGSTDSTFLVQDQGLYHVSAIDECGKIQHDSIIISRHPEPALDLGPDRTKCNEDTLLIAAPPGFVSYDWSPSYQLVDAHERQITVRPSVDTFYTVRAIAVTGCVGKDTIHITVNRSPVINLGPDTGICSDQSLPLSAPGDFSTYNWNTGHNSASINVTQLGKYWVTATSVNGCISMDTIEVNMIFELPSPSLGNNFSICVDESRLLDPGPFQSYSWQSGSTERTFKVSHPGTYTVNVTDKNGCSANSSVIVENLFPIPANFLEMTDSICPPDMLIIRPLHPFAAYSWSTGAIDSLITVTQEGAYILHVTDVKGCAGSDTISIVRRSDCYDDVFLPTAFTPNGDRLNDMFKAAVPSSVISFHLEIYDRRGIKVFVTNNPKEGWNGTSGGISQPAATFTWHCVYQLAGSKSIYRKGPVTLIR